MDGAVDFENNISNQCSLQFGWKRHDLWRQLTCNGPSGTITATINNKGKCSPCTATWQCDKAIQKSVYTTHVTLKLYGQTQSPSTAHWGRCGVQQNCNQVRWLERNSHANTSKPARQAVYQRRSGHRLFGAGDHIGLVVDLEGQSEQTGRQTWGQGRSDKALVSKQLFFMQLLWREKCPRAAVRESLHQCVATPNIWGIQHRSTLHIHFEQRKKINNS